MTIAMVSKRNATSDHNDRGTPLDMPPQKPRIWPSRCRKNTLHTQAVLPASDCLPPELTGITRTTQRTVLTIPIVLTSGPAVSCPELC